MFIDIRVKAGEEGGGSSENSRPSSTNSING